MLRAFWFLIKLSLLAAAFIWFAERPGTVTIVWQGYEIEVAIGLVAALALVAVVAVLLFDRLWRALVSVPLDIRRWRVARAQEKGYDEITRGFVAVAAGDAGAMKRHVATARALLPGVPLTHLLEAAVNLARGDQDMARLTFEGMLDDKRLAFFGLRGLLTQALSAGDMAAAREIAARVEKLHPRQGWVLKTLFDLDVRDRRWDEAMALLPRLKKHAGLDASRARRFEQALLLAQSGKLAEGGDQARALKLARKAFAIDSSFVPAALAVAGHFQRQGKRRAAVSVIRDGWPRAQHPELARIWGLLAPVSPKKTLTERKRGEYEWMKELAELAPFAIESKRALGQAALDAELWDEARQPLSDAGDYRALARLEKAQTGSEQRVREWLEMAADAPAPARWVCSSCGHSAFDWGPLCPSCHGFDVFAWETPGLRPAAVLPAGRDLLPPPVF